MSEFDNQGFNSVVEAVIAAYGSPKKTHEALGYRSVMNIYGWRTRGLPKARIVEIHEQTGLSLAFLKGGIVDKAVTAAGPSHAA